MAPATCCIGPRRCRPLQPSLDPTWTCSQSRRSCASCRAVWCAAAARPPSWAWSRPAPRARSSPARKVRARRSFPSWALGGQGVSSTLPATPSLARRRWPSGRAHPACPGGGAAGLAGTRVWRIGGSGRLARQHARSAAWTATVTWANAGRPFPALHSTIYFSTPLRACVRVFTQCKWRHQSLGSRCAQATRVQCRPALRRARAGRTGSGGARA